MTSSSLITLAVVALVVTQASAFGSYRPRFRWWGEDRFAVCRDQPQQNDVGSPDQQQGSNQFIQPTMGERMFPFLRCERLTNIEQRLSAFFAAGDTNNDGVISRQEMQNTLASFDVDADGCVSVEEFIQANAQNSFVSCETLVQRHADYVQLLGGNGQSSDSSSSSSQSNPPSCSLPTNAVWPDTIQDQNSAQFSNFTIQNIANACRSDFSLYQRSCDCSEVVYACYSNQNLRQLQACTDLIRLLRTPLSIRNFFQRNY